MSIKPSDDHLPEPSKDLGGGLLLRRAGRGDVEAIAAFNEKVHSPSGGPLEQRQPLPGLAAGTRDLMSAKHPTCGAGDFTLVENTRTGAVVSTACLIPQRFSYGGIEFDAGLPELVGTHPDYRGRGLVGEQFGVLHRWAKERGQLMLAIAGIPHYYRRFGYEMAVWMGSGRRLYAPDLPGKRAGRKDGRPAPYRLRPARASDAPFLSRLHGEARGRYLLTCARDEGTWLYEVVGRDPKSDESLQIRVVENFDAEPVGYVCHGRHLRDGSLQVDGYELARGVSWLEATPVVFDGLGQIGEDMAPSAGEFASLTFALGEHHPLCEAVPEPPLHPLDRESHYSFYVRVPHLPGFVRTVAPVLEKRLAGSVAAGHTGELKVGFYGDGLRLKLDGGRLSAAEAWKHNTEEDADAAFPGLTFLQLLFGHRSLEELDRSFADCSPGEGDARVLLKAMFPRRPSDFRPVC